MSDTENRLSDWFYTDSELKQMDMELLDETPYPYNCKPVKEYVVLFSISSKNGNTGKVMVVKTIDVMNTLNALNRLWSDTGLKFSLLKVSQEMYGADKLLDAIKIVLLPYKYITKFAGYKMSDNIYSFETWMLNLIKI